MDFDSSRPIYLQIIDGYRKQLIRGELRPGDRIPSQREYAEMAKVNPNTVQRAYREMERMQMVETLRGQGTFIKASPEMLENIRSETAAGLLAHFVTEMRSLGFSDREMVILLEKEQEKTREVSAVDRIQECE